jgi:urease accessory protein
LEQTLKPERESPVLTPSEELAHLRLLHLADSALPIGSLAHSFGLETLVSAELLQVGDLPEFLHGYLQEAGTLEAVVCREAFQLTLAEGDEFPVAQWIEINDCLSALKPARESRAASATLGRNFLHAALGVDNSSVLREARLASLQSASLIHQSAAFGLVSGALGFEETRTALAYLHQMSACMVSACQRLMPLGQAEATRILWNLKPTIVEVAANSASLTLETVSCTMPLLDWGAMEHPALATRLFIS